MPRRSRSGPTAEIERDVELQPARVSSAEYSTCPPYLAVRVGSRSDRGGGGVWVRCVVVNPGSPRFG